MSPPTLPRATAAALALARRAAWPPRTAQFATRRTLSTVHKISPPAEDQEPETPAKTFTVAARLDDGLLALRPSMGVSSASVKPGALLSLGDTARAAILCWRSGLAITAPLTSTPPPPAGAELELRPWRAGDRFHPSWKRAPIALKDFLRGQKLPLEERRALPLVCSGSDVLAVCAEKAHIGKPHAEGFGDARALWIVVQEAPGE